MFRDTLYQVIKSEAEDGTVKTTISISPDHEVFKGHFPGKPILPGVCSLQIVKEILEENLGERLILDNASNLKFLEIIDPNVITALTVNISYREQDGLLVVKSTIVDEAKSYYKFQGTYRRAA
tara:strand:+ start:117 stop:485 length:369 start_codon:yes stop_codon:yes gene_type:complete